MGAKESFNKKKTGEELSSLEFQKELTFYPPFCFRSSEKKFFIHFFYTIGCEFSFCSYSLLAFISQAEIFPLVSLKEDGKKGREEKRMAIDPDSVKTSLV